MRHLSFGKGLNYFWSRATHQAMEIKADFRLGELEFQAPALFNQQINRNAAKTMVNPRRIEGFPIIPHAIVTLQHDRVSP